MSWLSFGANQVERFALAGMAEAMADDRTALSLCAATGFFLAHRFITIAGRACLALRAALHQSRFTHPFQLHSPVQEVVA